MNSDQPVRVLRSADSGLFTSHEHQPNAIIVDYKRTREYTATMITDVHNLLAEHSTVLIPSPVLLGIGLVPDRHGFEYILANIPPECQLKIYNIG